MLVKQLALKNTENFNRNKYKKTLSFRVSETCKKKENKQEFTQSRNVPNPSMAGHPTKKDSNFMDNENKNTSHQMIQQHFH